MKRDQYIHVLRDIAAKMDADPTFPMPWSIYDDHVKWFILSGTDATIKASVRKVVKTMGGKWDKRLGEAMMSLVQKHDGYQLEIEFARKAVCTRRVVGTQEVTIDHPALAAREAQPARQETKTVEIVEWDCGSILATDQPDDDDDDDDDDETPTTPEPVTPEVATAATDPDGPQY